MSSPMAHLGRGVPVFELFPELRTRLSNQQGAIVAHCALRICEFLGQVGTPLSVAKLQQMFIATGAEWAEGRNGYLFILSQVKRLQEAGVIQRDRRSSFRLAGEAQLVDLFAAALVRVVKESIPDVGRLKRMKDLTMVNLLNFTEFPR